MSMYYIQKIHIIKYVNKTLILKVMSDIILIGGGMNDFF